MFKITAKYNDFENNEVTKDLYFNMSVKEMAELNTKDPTYAKRLQDAGKSGNQEKVTDALADFMLKSYRVREGDRLVRDPEATAKFKDSLAMDSALAQLIFSTGDQPNVMFKEFLQNVIPALPAESVNAIDKAADKYSHSEF